MLVAIEGIDGSGKTSVSRALFDLLSDSGIDAVLTREPGGTPLAEKLREILLSKDKPWQASDPKTRLLLFSAARLDHQRKVIVPAISRGAVVISDRNISSMRAYQHMDAILNQSDPGDIAEMERASDMMCREFIPVKPNIIAFVDVSPETSIRRCRMRSEETGESTDQYDASDLDFRRKLRQRFFELMKSGKDGEWVYFSSDKQSAKEIAMALFRLVVERIGANDQADHIQECMTI